MHALGEYLAGPENACSDGIDGHCAGTRNLGVTQAVEDAQDQRVGELGRHFSEDPLHGHQCLLKVQVRRRGVVRYPVRRLHVAVLAFFAGRGEVQRKPPLPPRIVECPIQCDPVQPGVERGIVAKCGQRAKCLDERFLGDVFGIFGLFDDAVGQPVNAALIFFDQSGEAVEIANIGFHDKCEIFVSIVQDNLPQNGKAIFPEI